MKISAEDVDSLLSIAACVLDPAGVLLRANAGLLRLLGAPGEQRIGTRIGRFFIQPDFATLAQATPGKDGEIYRGLMTIGEYAGRTHSLRGRVWRTTEGIRLLAEHDVEEFDRMSDAMQEVASEALLSQRAIGVENLRLKSSEARLAEASLSDVLTGVGNRRKLDQALEVEIARAERADRPLSALMADIDHFKNINDRYGHAAGDRVLARFGALLQAQTRPTDIVARFGGEEFVVLMPNTALARATEVAERIRKALELERMEPLDEPVTSSFGVAQYAPGEEAEALLRHIDAALYRAKHAGRNRVSVAAA